MNPYTRAALFLIRVAAFGLVLYGALFFMRYVFPLLGGPRPRDGVILRLAHGLVLAGGILLWARSRRIARRLTEDFDS